MTTLGDKIRIERETKKLKQEDLARLLNLRQTTISSYETNNSQPSYEMLIKIADLFEVSTDYLLGRED